MKMTRIVSLFAGALLVHLASIAAAQNIVVGGKNFTEQQIMSQMTAQLLQAKGYKVDVKAGMGSAVLR
ncbi:MAG: glycine betaine ABC transporter substrate-binding protein, partial [Casimicrobiaceae bacterium]